MIRATTRLACVIGDPIAHSLSPKLHNRMIAHLGLDACYLAFRVESDRLGAAVGGLDALGTLGFNVTMPHKSAVIEFLSRVEEPALTLGSVNTVFRDGDGSFVGTSTDGPGFLLALREIGRFDPEGKTVGLVGSGPAARAVAFELARSGGQVLVHARNRAKGLEVARLSGGSIAATESELAQCDLIVNATSVGMDGGPAPAASPVGPEVFRAGQTVFDLVYHPVDTVFLQTARSQGARAIDGRYMLCGQAVLSFERFFGRSVDLAVALSALG